MLGMSFLPEHLMDSSTHTVWLCLSEKLEGQQQARGLEGHGEATSVWSAGAASLADPVCRRVIPFWSCDHFQCFLTRKKIHVIISTAPKRGCSHPNLFWYFYVKVRTCRWPNHRHQVGACS